MKTKWLWVVGLLVPTAILTVMAPTNRGSSWGSQTLTNGKFSSSAKTETVHQSLRVCPSEPGGHPVSWAWVSLALAVTCLLCVWSASLSPHPLLPGLSEGARRLLLYLKRRQQDATPPSWGSAEEILRALGQHLAQALTHMGEGCSRARAQGPRTSTGF